MLTCRIKILLMTLIFCLAGAVAAPHAQAAGPFDGKWRIDAEGMAEHNPEFKAIRDNPHVWEQVRADLEGVEFEIDTTRRTYAENFDGEAPSSGSFVIISQDAQTLSFQPDSENDIFVLTLTGPGTMHMTLQGSNANEVLYFKR